MIENENEAMKAELENLRSLINAEIGRINEGEPYDIRALVDIGKVALTLEDKGVIWADCGDGIYSERCVEAINKYTREQLYNRVLEIMSDRHWDDTVILVVGQIAEEFNVFGVDIEEALIDKLR